MIRAVIIDDQPHAIEALERVIANFPKSFEIAGAFQTIDDAIIGVTQLSPDLVFLDVEIHNDTGFDFLERIKYRDFQVVFTTAYSKYAYRAFQFSALHYLLKPVAIEDFVDVIERLKKEEDHKNYNQKIDTLLYNHHVDNSLKKIIIETASESLVVKVSEILYCLSDGNYTDIHLIGNKKIMSAKTLKIYEEQLNDFNFFRVDQKALVNLDYIKKYTKGSPMFVIMEDGKSIKVAINRKPQLIKTLKQNY